MAKKAKNIHLDEDVVRKITLIATQKGTVFKLFVEDLLTRFANQKK